MKSKVLLLLLAVLLNGVVSHAYDNIRVGNYLLYYLPIGDDAVSVSIGPLTEGDAIDSEAPLNVLTIPSHINGLEVQELRYCWDIPTNLERIELPGTVRKVPKLMCPLDFSKERTSYISYQNVSIYTYFMNWYNWNEYARCDIELRDFIDSMCLKWVDVDDSNPWIKSINGVVYSKDGKQLLLFPPYSEEKTLAAGVEVVGSNAFAGSHIISMTIPESVVSINTDSLFRGCRQLRRVAFKCEIDSLGTKMFFVCRWLRELRFREGTTLSKIGVGAFYRSYLPIEAPEGKYKRSRLGYFLSKYNVKYIDRYAFSDCFNLGDDIVDEDQPYIKKYECYQDLPSQYGASKTVGDLINIPTHVAIAATIIIPPCVEYIGYGALTFNWISYQYPKLFNLRNNTSVETLAPELRRRYKKRSVIIEDGPNQLVVGHMFMYGDDVEAENPFEMGLGDAGYGEVLTEYFPAKEFYVGRDQISLSFSTMEFAHMCEATIFGPNVKEIVGTTFPRGTYFMSKVPPRDVSSESYSYRESRAKDYTIYVPRGCYWSYRLSKEEWRWRYYKEIIEVLYELDVDGDRQINIGDVNNVLQKILDPNFETRFSADADGDGLVSVGDVNSILNAILMGYQFGD